MNASSWFVEVGLLPIATCVFVAIGGFQIAGVEEERFARSRIFEERKAALNDYSSNLKCLAENTRLHHKRTSASGSTSCPGRALVVSAESVSGLPKDASNVLDRSDATTWCTNDATPTIRIELTGKAILTSVEVNYAIVDAQKKALARPKNTSVVWEGGSTSVQSSRNPGEKSILVPLPSVSASWLEVRPQDFGFRPMGQLMCIAGVSISGYMAPATYPFGVLGIGAPKSKTSSIEGLAPEKLEPSGGPGASGARPPSPGGTTTVDARTPPADGPAPYQDLPFTSAWPNGPAVVVSNDGTPVPVRVSPGLDSESYCGLPHGARATITGTWQKANLFFQPVTTVCPMGSVSGWIAAEKLRPAIQ